MTRQFCSWQPVPGQCLTWTKSQGVSSRWSTVPTKEQTDWCRNMNNATFYSWPRILSRPVLSYCRTHIGTIGRFGDNLVPTETIHWQQSVHIKPDRSHMWQYSVSNLTDWVPYVATRFSSSRTESGRHMWRTDSADQIMATYGEQILATKFSKKY